MSIVVKSNLKGDIRRFSIAPTTTLSGLITILSQLYKFKDPNSVQLSYLEDSIERSVAEKVLGSDAELHEALSIAQAKPQPVLRITVTTATTTTTTTTITTITTTTTTIDTSTPSPRMVQSVIYFQGKPIYIQKMVQPEGKQENKGVAPTVSNAASSNRQDSYSKSVPSSSLSNSISQLCLEASNLLVKETNSISSNTAANVKAMSNSTSSDTISSSSLMLSDKSGNVVETVDKMISKTKEESSATSDATRASIVQVPNETIKIQNEALAGLEEKITQNVEEAVRLSLAASNSVNQ